jgi:hypothetical protein
MKSRKNNNIKLSDSAVIITIAVTLIFTSLTVSSGVIGSTNVKMSILQNDPNINIKEFQRAQSTLMDDVCDDCDDDDDTFNSPPEAIIYEVIPNPGYQFQEISFEGYGEDSDGEIVEYLWESDIDGNFGYEPYFSYDSLSAGTHTISFYVRDNNGAWSNPDFMTLEVIENQPPEIPAISGNAKGPAGEPVTFKFITSDPEHQDVFYYIDWGDGTEQDWFGPYASDEQKSVDHTWVEEGTYSIRAKAKDIYDAESDWGTLEVQMPHNILMYNHFFAFLIKIIERFPQLSILV